jgi:hypothetical protein
VTKTKPVTMSKLKNPFTREDWIEELIKQAPEFKEFQKQSFNNFKAIAKLEKQRQASIYEVENKSGLNGFFQIFTTHALTASLTAMLCLGGIATFAAEKSLPTEYKPSTFVSKINPFSENLKGGKTWYGTVISSSSIISSDSSLTASSSNSIGSSSVSSLILSSSSSSNSSLNSVSISSRASSVLSSSVTISSVTSSSSISSSSIISSSSKKPELVESQISEVINPKVDNIKLKFGESGPDKSTFTMKDADGSIYMFNNVAGINIDLIDLTKPESEYIYSGNLSETIIDRTKYPAIKWKIFNAKDSSRFEALK